MGMTGTTDNGMSRRCCFAPQARDYEAEVSAEERRDTAAWRGLNRGNPSRSVSALSVAVLRGLRVPVVRGCWEGTDAAKRT